MLCAWASPSSSQWLISPRREEGKQLYCVGNNYSTFLNNIVTQCINYTYVTYSEVLLHNNIIVMYILAFSSSPPPPPPLSLSLSLTGIVGAS